MLGRLVDRTIGGMAWLDGVGEALQDAVGAVFKAFGPLKDGVKSFLHGTWLGHALHPLLTDVPVGAWTAAVLADIVFLTGHLPRAAGDFAVFAGVIAGFATLVTGYTDFHETYGHERRTATLHGLLMTTALALYTASWLIRWLGADSAHSLAIWLSFVGYALVASSAYLGGHLTFGFGTMVNRNAFSEASGDEVEVGVSADFPEGGLKRVDAGGMPLLVTRQAGRLCAIGAVCSHAGGPLDEGKLKGGVVTCPWHGSRFDVCSGDVRRGPATFPQPRYSIREDSGTVRVKLEEQVHG